MTIARIFNNATNGVTGLDLPFVFVQIAPWPNLDSSVIPVQRFAQSAALKLANTAMVVSADQVRARTAGGASSAVLWLYFHLYLPASVYECMGV